MNTTATATLNNFEVRKLTDKNLQEYFMIINNDNRDEVYFCFRGTIDEKGWEILNRSPLPLNIEIEYMEQKDERTGRIFKRAKSLYTDDDIIV